jgi:hypothetical protein
MRRLFSRFAFRHFRYALRSSANLFIRGTGRAGDALRRSAARLGGWIGVGKLAPQLVGVDPRCAAPRW